MRKLYKYNKYDMDYYYSSHPERQTIVGYIGEKEVDEYNGSIKVFIPIGEILSGARLFGLRGADVDINICDSGDEYEYLSNLKLKELKEKEVKGVLEALYTQMNERLGEASNITKLINELEYKS